MVKTRAKRKAEDDVSREFELDSRTTNLCNLVFGIELLREIIIDFVIHDHHNKEGFSKQNALSCRLVQKSWLESVCRCLFKSGKWLVQVGAEYERSIESFLKIYDPSYPLPFKLSTWFITGTVERDLERCLQICNNGLVELDLQRRQSEHHLVLGGEPLQGFLQQKFNLLKLRKLKYCVEPSSLLPGEYRENNAIDSYSFPQLILSGAFNLKYFDFGFIRYTTQNGRILPLPAAAVSLGNLLLPGTIKKLVLNCQLGTPHLEPLLKINKLSNLTDLIVEMPDVPNGDSEWFFRLLNRVSYTLKNLRIHGGLRLRNQTIATIDPPVMKCLKQIYIFIVNFDWVDGITDLHRKLPALETLHLRDVRSCSLKKWVENSEFDLLTDLSVAFFDFRQPPHSFLTIENAQLMSKAFVKVTKLYVSTPCVDATYKAVQCLFQNMTQLQVFTLELNEIEGHVLPPRYFDALLLGISCELIETLKADCAPGKLWETVQLNMDEQQSVVNLSQLEEFYLHRSGSSTLSSSNKVKAFVASKMPKLQTIILPRPIKISSEHSTLYEDWKKL